MIGIKYLSQRVTALVTKRLALIS